MDLFYQRIADNLAPIGPRPSSTADEYFIFCVGQDEYTIDHFKRWSLENDVMVKPLIGQYHGHIENAFIANMNDYQRLKRWFATQESVLLLGRREMEVREATMEYQPTQYEPEGKQVKFGKFKRVAKRVALQHDSWTFDHFTGNYYIVDKD